MVGRRQTGKIIVRNATASSLRRGAVDVGQDNYIKPSTSVAIQNGSTRSVLLHEHDRLRLALPIETPCHLDRLPNGSVNILLLYL